MGLAGILAGALGLIALETLVQPGPSGRVGGMFTSLSLAAANFLDPNVALIGGPRRRSAATASTSTPPPSSAPAAAYNPSAPPPFASPTTPSRIA